MSAEIQPEQDPSTTELLQGLAPEAQQRLDAILSRINDAARQGLEPAAEDVEEMQTLLAQLPEEPLSETDRAMLDQMEGDQASK